MRKPLVTVNSAVAFAIACLTLPLGAAPEEQAAAPPAAGKATKAPSPKPAAGAKPGAGAKPDAGAKPGAGAKPATKKPPIFDTEINGFLELQQKADVCFQSNRRMLVVLGTNDCDLCRVVNSAIHERMFYDVLFKQFVPVFIDVTPGSRNSQLLKNLKVDESKGLPVIAIFDDKNVFMEATQKGEMVSTAKKGVEAVQGWIIARLIKTDG